MPTIPLDMDFLIMALESDPGFGQWFLDKDTGEIIPVSDYADRDAAPTLEELEEKSDRYLSINPLPSGVGWDIMSDFVENLADPAVQKLLARALGGRKPFRSFKDELLVYPAIREQWFKYHEKRMREIAIEWLQDNEIDFVQKPSQISREGVGSTPSGV